MPSHPDRVRQANCDHIDVKGAMTLEHGHIQICSCGKWWTDANYLLVQLRRLAPPVPVPLNRPYDHDFTGESPYAQEHARRDEGVQGQEAPQRVEERPSGNEPEAGDCDRSVGATPDGARDKETGIAIRFVKQYDVEADKTPRCQSLETTGTHAFFPTREGTGYLMVCRDCYYCANTNSYLAP